MIYNNHLNFESLIICNHGKHLEYRSKTCQEWRRFKRWMFSKSIGIARTEILVCRNMGDRSPVFQGCMWDKTTRFCPASEQNLQDNAATQLRGPKCPLHRLFLRERTESWQRQGEGLIISKFWSNLQVLFHLQ